MRRYKRAGAAPPRKLAGRNDKERIMAATKPAGLTPRTDAFSAECGARYGNDGSRLLAALDLARQLERELSALSAADVGQEGVIWKLDDRRDLSADEYSEPGIAI